MGFLGLNCCDSYPILTARWHLGQCRGEMLRRYYELENPQPLERSNAHQVAQMRVLLSCDEDWDCVTMFYGGISGYKQENECAACD